MTTVRIIGSLAAMAFAITLAIIVAQRLSTEAMAVLLGVLAGAAASIPTSLLTVWVSLKAQPKAPLPPRETTVERVVMVPAYPAANASQPTAGVYPTQPYASQPPVPPREFTVIGGASDFADIPYHPMEAH